jgi:hypothetical protein
MRRNKYLLPDRILANDAFWQILLKNSATTAFGASNIQDVEPPLARRRQ